MTEDHHDQDDEQDAGDPSDRRVGEVLADEAGFLRELAELLLTTRSISIERPAGTVTVQLIGPVWRWTGGVSWRRRYLMDLHAVSGGDCGKCAGAQGPLQTRPRDRDALIREITLTLAIDLVWLEEER